MDEGLCVPSSWRPLVPRPVQPAGPSVRMYRRNGLSDGTSIHSLTSEVRASLRSYSVYISIELCLYLSTWLQMSGVHSGWWWLFLSCLATSSYLTTRGWRGFWWSDEMQRRQISKNNSWKIGPQLKITRMSVWKLFPRAAEQLVRAAEQQSSSLEQRGVSIICWVKTYSHMWELASVLIRPTHNTWAPRRQLLVVWVHWCFTAGNNPKDTSNSIRRSGRRVWWLSRREERPQRLELFQRPN